MSTDNVKPGSNPSATPVAEGDFGVKATDTHEREYVSKETLQNDPGRAVARSGTGPRDTGVGSSDSGPGTGSAGELDVSSDALTGVADKNQHPPTAPSPEAGERPVMDPPVVNPDAAGSDASTSADDVTNETQHDSNAFKGDITMDEASGNSSK
jgi:hypothetical protein